MPSRDGRQPGLIPAGEEDAAGAVEDLRRVGPQGLFAGEVIDGDVLDAVALVFGQGRPPDFVGHGRGHGEDDDLPGRSKALARAMKRLIRGSSRSPPPMMKRWPLGPGAAGLFGEQAGVTTRTVRKRTRTREPRVWRFLRSILRRDPGRSIHEVSTIPQSGPEREVVPSDE